MAMPDYDEQPILYDPDFKGPKRNRVCTDVFFLGLYIAFMVGWAGIGIYALSLGSNDVSPTPAPDNYLQNEGKIQYRISTTGGMNDVPVSEITHLWWKILMLLILAITLCFLYMFTIKFYPAPVVWTSIAAVLLLMTAAIITCFVLYGTRGDEALPFLILGIVSTVILLVIIIVLICARNKIKVSISIIQVGARSVLSIKSTIFFPLVLILMHAAAAYFAADIFHRIDAQGSGRMEDGFGKRFCIAYNVFAYIWTYFYISALGEMILAITFGTWYWTFNKNDVPYFTLSHSIYKTYRYHLGTVAFGSLILTIIRIIRMLLKNGNGNSSILCLFKCFFAYIESLIRFINRNAYIMSGIHGTNFCTSAKDAFSLIMRNAGQFIIAHQVTGLLFFFCQLVVILIIGGLSYASFMHNTAVLVYLPIVITVFGTIVITSQFFGVCDIATNTVTLCFLEDRERNNGSTERPYYMSNELMHILEVKNEPQNRNNVVDYERVLQ